MPPINDILVRGIKAKNDADKAAVGKDAKAQALQFKELVDAVVAGNKAVIAYLQKNKLDVKVANPTAMDLKPVVDKLNELKTSEPDNRQLTRTLAAINVTLTRLPNLLTNDKVEISNVRDLINGLSDEWAKLIPAIQEAVKQPEIKLPTPKVSVAAPDLQPLLDEVKSQKAAIENITTTLNHLKFPVPTVPTDPLVLYTPADIEDTDASQVPKSTQYFGYTKSDGSWYIRKYTYSTVPKTLRFAFGLKTYSSGSGTGYAAAWADRASLAYALWSD